MVDITIGSDPEFLIADSEGNIACAMCIFTESYIDCNHKDCCDLNAEDCNLFEDDDLLDAKIGCDCEIELGELRPKYADTPEKHHNNITKLIKQIDIPKGFKVLAGTTHGGYSLGGHIHFGGIPEPSDNVKYNERIENIRNISKYISYYAGIPLKLIEHQKDLSKRGMTEYGYGSFGNHRHKRYGLEWRMPASWLVSSEIALATLSLSYVVAYEYMIDPEIIDDGFNTYIKIIKSRNIYNIIDQIEGMEKYGRYAKKIDPIFQLISENKRWNKDVNILEMW